MLLLNLITATDFSDNDLEKTVKYKIQINVSYEEAYQMTPTPF